MGTTTSKPGQQIGGRRPVAGGAKTVGEALSRAGVETPKTPPKRSPAKGKETAAVTSAKDEGRKATGRRIAGTQDSVGKELNSPERLAANVQARKDKNANGKKMHYTGILHVSRAADADWEIRDPLTMATAMLNVGYEPAEEGEAIFKDPDGNAIKLTKNTSNRPFKPNLAKRYMNDNLRRKWRLNGETIIHDEEDMVQSGQHRYVGLIWAEMVRRKDPAKWADYWGDQPVEMECLIFRGISADRDTINTIDIGAKRTLGDVLFREDRFPKNMPAKKRAELASIMAGAARLVWLRSQQKTVSDAPHYPHSEALEFVEAHTKLLESVYHVWAEEGGKAADGKKISSWVSLPYAAGLHYLMATSGTEPAVFQEQPTLETAASVLDFSCEQHANLFWIEFAREKIGGEGGKAMGAKHPIKVLKSLLRGQEASSGWGRDAIIAMIIKAFNLWIDGKLSVDVADIEPVEKELENGRYKLDEHPTLGGMDVEERTTKPQKEEAGEVVDTRKGKQKKKDKWSKGDTCWCFASDGEHYFGKIEKIVSTQDGVGLAEVMQDNGDGPWEVPLSELSIEKPE